MSIKQFCNKKLIRMAPDATAYEIAKKMKNEHVNDVVIEDKSKPVGLVTDRDLFLQIAEGADFKKIKASEFMSKDPVQVKTDDGLFEAISTMQQKGIRRLLVVDSKNAVCGIVGVDGIIQLLGEELNKLGSLVKDQAFREKVRTQKVPEHEQDIAV